MADDDLDLRSVNWSQGMFLTPDHFLRQERYVDSLFMWLLRYSQTAYGLVGGGPRVETNERGAPRFDPVVEIDDSGDTLKVTVTQCRGVTPGGLIVDVQPSHALQASFSKRELEGALDVGVYVVSRPHDKEADDSLDDPVNPQTPLGRRSRYTIRLDVQADEAPASLLLTRLRRAEKGLRFERAMNFIPPCAFMSSHSSLMYSFRQLNELVATIADHYSALHRAIVDFIGVARARGLNVEQDNETLAFVSRMVMTLEACAYEILDPLQPPRKFFQEMTRLVRSAALFLSLSPPTREYFRLLGEIGEVEFVSMLQQEGEALEMGRGFTIQEDLNVEVQKVMRSLERLDRLEQALEGKYMDYRLSPSLESINFVFDRTGGDPVLYKSVAKPARPQAQGQELTFVFAPLRLEARETYRLILVGERQARFVPGDRITAELRINPGEGYSHPPDYPVAVYEIDGQRNFAVDFKAPDDVVTINDVRVSLRSTQPIRSAILYVRGRLLSAAVASQAPPPLMPRAPVQPRLERPAVQGAQNPTVLRRPGRLQEDTPRGQREETKEPTAPPGRRNRLS
jgi:hypothetical protein